MRERSLACVARVSEIINVDPLVEDLQRAVDANQRFLNKILNERAQREMDNRLRREQEEEYKQALAIDRRKVAERRRLESEKIESQQREAEEQRKLEEKQNNFKTLKEKIKVEIDQLEEPTADIVRVSVRFPSGGKFDRKFSEEDTLEVCRSILGYFYKIHFVALIQSCLGPRKVSRRFHVAFQLS